MPMIQIESAQLAQLYLKKLEQYFSKIGETCKYFRAFWRRLCHNPRCSLGTHPNVLRDTPEYQSFAEALKVFSFLSQHFLTARRILEDTYDLLQAPLTDPVNVTNYRNS
jgi:hypothetical protein